MADLATQIAKAKSAGYSDGEIAAFLGKDPAFAPKIAEAKKAGYDDAEIVGHLATVKAEAKPKPRSLVSNVTGAMANFNRGLGIGDELAAGFGTLADAATGKLPARPNVLKSLASGFGNRMAEQRQIEDDFAQAHPKSAALASGTGMAATAALPGAPAVQGSNIAMKVARGAVSAALPAAAFGLADRGNMQERLGAANRNALAAGAIGGALGAAFGRTSAAPDQKPSTKTPLGDVVAKMDAAGVTPNLATARGGGYSTVANAIAENPIAGIRPRAALSKNVDEVAASAENLAGKYGSPSSRGATGEEVQAGISDFNRRFSDRASKLYDKAFADIEQGQAAKLATSKAESELRSARMGNFQSKPTPAIAPDATRAALSEMGGRVNAPPLSQVITDPRLSRIASALEGGAQDLRFGDLRALRTWVRDAQTSPELRQGINQGQLKRLEGSLTQDIYQNAEALGGPTAARRLKQADSFYRLGSERIQGALQSFVGKAQPKAGESTYDMVLRAAADKGGADSARLAALKKSLKPEEWNDVAATTIERLGKPTAGTAEAGDFSISRFVTGYSDLSDAGRNLLFGTGPLRKELDNLAEVAGMVKRVEKGANVSKSGVALQSLGTVAGLANPATALPTAKTLGGMAITGEALTNPLMVRWLAKLAKAEQTSPAAYGSAVAELQKAANSNEQLQPLLRAVGVNAPAVAGVIATYPTSAAANERRER